MKPELRPHLWTDEECDAMIKPLRDAWNTTPEDTQQLYRKFIRAGFSATHKQAELIVETTGVGLTDEQCATIRAQVHKAEANRTGGGDYRRAAYKNALIRAGHASASVPQGEPVAWLSVVVTPKGTRLQRLGLTY
jgi:hypothetical protein